MRLKKFLTLLLVTILVSSNVLSQTGTKTNKKIQRLLKDLGQTGEGPERVLILKDLCREYRDSDPEKALDYGKKAVELGKKINFQKGVADCYNSIGIIYKRMGRQQQAFEYYYKSLEIKKEIGDQRGVANTYNNIGSLFKSQGNFQKAADYYLKSIEIKEKIGDKESIAAAYSRVGVVYKYQENFNQALNYLFKSLEIRKELGKNKEKR